MLKWLEPAIENRAEEILNAVCENEQNDLYKKFIDAAKSVRETNMDAFLELENIFLLHTKQTVNIAYRSGFEDGLDVGTKIK